MNSLLLVAGTLDGLTTSTIGVAPTTAIGVKSPGMSKGSDLITLGKITTLFDTTDSVLPSGAERASACKPDDAARAGLVVDHHRRVERLVERRLGGARDGVHAGAGGVGQDERTMPDWRIARCDQGAAAMAAEAASIVRREKRFVVLVMSVVSIACFVPTSGRANGSSHDGASAHVLDLAMP